MIKKIFYFLLLTGFSILLFNCNDEVSFKPIAVETKEVISTDFEAAVVTGKITEFGKGVDTFGHCWSINPIPSIEDDTTIVTKEVGGDYQSLISGLEDEVKYYFRAYAKNNEKVAYGEIKEFTTESNPLEIGLVAYYPFNGDANDYSENAYAGINYGATLTADRLGNENSAYSFDGVDNFIQTSNEIDDCLGDGASFAVWINISVAHTGRIISNFNGDGGYGSRIGFVFGVTSDLQLNIFYATNADAYIGRMTNIGDLEPNTWYHVVGVWDGTFDSSGFKLYINGVRMDAVNQESGFVSSSYLESEKPFHFGIGYCTIGACWPFDGKIDEVRIYNKILDETEIQALYHENICFE